MTWRLREKKPSSALTFVLTLMLMALLASCGGAEGPAQPGPEGQPEQPRGDGKTLIVEASGAAWVAYQRDEGAWQVLEGAERYTLELDPNARYGVAHVCADEADAEEITEVSVTFIYATLAARSSVPAPCPEAEDETDFYTLSGTVSGLADDEIGRVYGEFQTSRVTAEENAYSLAGFTAGEYDLLATVQNTPSTPDTSSLLSPPSKILVREGLPIERDQTLDLDLSDAVSTVLREVTLEGIAPESEVYSSVSLVTARAASAELGFFADEIEAQDKTVSFDYAALPTSSEKTKYRLLVESFSEDERDNLSRSLERTFAAPDDVTFSLPDPLGATEVSLAEGRPTTTWDPYAPNADYRAVFESSSTGETEREARYVIALDDTWLVDTGPLTYALPDFSDLVGWRDTWTLGAPLYWALSANVENENEVIVVSRSSTLGSAAE